MSLLAKLRFAIAREIPGTSAHREMIKRKFKNTLRDAGFTRSQLRRIARSHFQKDEQTACKRKSGGAY